MTDRPAVFLGDFVDLRFMPGLKVARVSLEIPIEESHAFISAFGTPNKVEPMKVAIARLVEGAPSGAEESGNVGEWTKPTADSAGADLSAAREVPAAGSNPAVPRAFRDLPRSQQCAIKCDDPDFIDWIRTQSQNFSYGEIAPASSDSERRANGVKSVLRISSRKELDTDDEAGKRWANLLVSFDMRAYTR